MKQTNKQTKTKTNKQTNNKTLFFIEVTNTVDFNMYNVLIMLILISYVIFLTVGHWGGCVQGSINKDPWCVCIYNFEEKTSQLS